MFHFNGKPVDFWSLENFEEHVHRDYFLKCLLGCLSLEEFFWVYVYVSESVPLFFWKTFFSSKDLGNQTMQILFG